MGGRCSSEVASERKRYRWLTNMTFAAMGMIAGDAGTRSIVYFQAHRGQVEILGFGPGDRDVETSTSISVWRPVGYLIEPDRFGIGEHGARAADDGVACHQCRGSGADSAIAGWAFEDGRDWARILVLLGPSQGSVKSYRA